MPTVGTDRIEKQILLRAPRTKVWRAISDVDQFGAWFGAKLDGPFTPGATVRGVIVGTQADADAVRNQLKGPEWSRVMGFKSTGDNETAEIHIRTENKKVTGVAILVTEPREFTVVNISGNIDLEHLADLGGHFGVPRLTGPQRKGDKKDE